LYLLIAYFLSNISAKYYKNPTMLSRVTAKNVESTLEILKAEIKATVKSLTNNDMTIYL